jgi:hypothetical protein
MFPPNQPCHQHRVEILAIFDHRYSESVRSRHRHQDAFQKQADQKLLDENRVALIARPRGPERLPV